MFLIYILVFIGFLSNLKSQELPLYNQYLLNGYLLNPAVFGSVKHPTVILTDRQQWIGIRNAPQTQAITSAIRLGDFEGVGAVIYNDRNGAISRIGIKIAYAHHMILNRFKKLKMSLGCAFSGYQYNIDHAGFGDIEITDPLIIQSVKSKYIPDASFGAYIYSKTYFGGISIANLLSTPIQYDENSENVNQNPRNIFISGGYRYKFHKEFSYEPSLLLKSTFGFEWQLDVNSKLYYQDRHWIGVSFRTSKSIQALIGFKIKSLRFAYAYEYNANPLNAYSYGTHELMISYNIGERETNYICPAYF